MYYDDYINHYGDPRATLCHFNPNHDPRNGQFARRVGGIARAVTKGEGLSERGKTIRKRAGIAAGAMAGASGIATIGNAVNAQKALNAMGYGDRISIPGATASGLVKAGSVAMMTGLAVIGGHMISDYMRDSKHRDK